MRFTQHEIAELRNALGLNLSQFAELVGVTTATASRWESGDRFPSRAADEKLEQLYVQKLAKMRKRPSLVAAG